MKKKRKKEKHAVDRRKEKHAQERKTVTLEAVDYQPSRAEMDEEIRIPASPEELMKAVVQDVKVKRRKLKD